MTGPTTRADIVVVGMGVGGEAVAGSLAEAGLDVVGIEAELVGGECPYWGCIPSKMMIRAANLIAEASRIPGMSGTVDVRPDWTPVADRIRHEATDDWNDQVAVDRFTGKGGRFVRGAATVLGPRSVSVEGVGVIEARRGIVLATGTSSVAPPIDGLADTPFWTNREAVSAKDLPASLVVLGGGAIGVEIGQAFARFEVEVTVVEAAERILPAEEPEVSALLADTFRSEGITVLAGRAATQVGYAGGTFAIRLDNGDDVTAEGLLVATGRRPQVAPEMLRALELEPGLRALPVDERMRVADGVWAVGDVTGKGAFTHVATYQADLVVADVLGRPTPEAEYRALPRVTFTDPEVGSVGLSEAQAREQGLAVAVGTANLQHTARGWLHKAGSHGLIKLVMDTDTGLLVGATSAGPVGGEVLGALAVAIHGRVPVEQLRHMIWAYPTFHRGIQDALRDLPIG
ncbi:MULTISPECIES: NAD(P)/FAD-dependent oxidoreductase [unclassified Nocardioides]|uniref:dihydrolipoyl dehydrogenase family protein n=1 Tax=unclassified Nocardioides TaxID=2615069 RepID=UPI00005701E3|nr:MULTISPECIES: NAD(P)/FAD-dependent oxidoreductase [unclassified Nocardioides]ABL81582.1 pyridine nucleotide-disulfide oxidoreductase dimerization region [Nocardioides sp. JS614]